MLAAHARFRRTPLRHFVPPRQSAESGVDVREQRNPPAIRHPAELPAQMARVGSVSAITLDNDDCDASMPQERVPLHDVCS